MLTRRGFLGGSLALGGGLLARSSTGSGAGASVGPARRLIVVFAQGGWDTCYAVDPKEGSSVFDLPETGTVQRFGNLDVLCDPSRPSIAEYFRSHGGVTAIVRGIDTQTVIHPDAHRRILTGTRRETNPDMAAMVAHDCGNDLPLPYLILSSVAYTGPYGASAGRAGFYNQLGQLLGGETTAAPYVDARGTHQLPIPKDPIRGVPELSEAEEAAVRRFHEASVERERAVRGAAGYNRARLDDFLEGGARGKRLQALRARFGTAAGELGFEAQIPLAVDAIAQDVSYAVLMNAGEAWDTHYDNNEQGELHEWLFANLKLLVDELAARPGRAAGSRMIDDTVVAVVSEFSRTPKLSDGGKDHWPVAAALVIGAGVRDNTVVGGTTPTGDPERIDVRTGAVDAGGVGLTTAMFVGAVLDLCGVDPGSHLPATTPLEALRA